MTSTAYNMTVSNKLKESNFGYKDRDAQQKIRKRVFKVSNPLSDYYLPTIHRRTWWPNGKYQVHQRYEHGESGLRHHYEKNNVEILEDLIKDQTKPPKKEEIHRPKPKNVTNYFKEFDDADENDYIITIEYCSNCEEHSQTTQHSSTMYKTVAFNYQKIISQRFPFLKVFLKPIDVDIVKEVNYKIPEHKNGEPYPSVFIINDQFKKCKIGAFEIQFYNKNSGVQLIHSKLFTKTWPQVDSVIKRILNCLPLLDLEIILYDKGEYKDREKINKIPISLYLKNDSDVKDYVENTQRLIADAKEPGKRLETMKENVRLGKAGLLTEFGERPMTTFRNNTQSGALTSKRANTSTGFRTNISIDKSECFGSKNMKINCDLSTQKGCLMRKKYSNIDAEAENEESKNNSAVNKKSQTTKETILSEKTDNTEEEIEEEEDGECGVSTKILFKNLKYDTYIVETGETSDFLSSINLVKFMKVEGKKKIVRHIGLMHQTRAIIQVFPYVEKESADSKQTGIKDFELVKTASITALNVKNQNLFSITQNSNGIFEYRTEPGEYRITIEDKKYESVVKNVKVEMGVNKINVQLHHERQCKIVIKVLSMELTSQRKKSSKKFDKEKNEEDKNNESQEELKKDENEKSENEQIEDNDSYLPISNAEIKIYKNSDELLNEGITDLSGKTSFVIDTNEHTLSISVNKMGYFPSQRFFTRNKNMKVNKKTGRYEFTLTFILVKEDVLKDTNNILIIGYTNLHKKIFDFKIQARRNEEGVIIKDTQEKNGIIIAKINCDYNDEKDEDDEDYYKDENHYDQIFRVGLIFKKLNEEKAKVKYENMNENQKQIYFQELIDYLNNVCAECMVYTQNNYFSIRIPRSIFKSFNQNEENQYQEPEGISLSQTEIKQKNSNNEEMFVESDIEQIEVENEEKEENGLYWDLGWLDYKNKMFYETSAFFNLDNIPIREVYFEEWIELLQKILDQHIYKNLFAYFNFKISHLTGDDRLGNNAQFCDATTKLIELTIDENDPNYDLIVQKNNDVLSFILSLFCIEDDVTSYDNLNTFLVSYNLLKKKITSNLKNFCNINDY